MTFASLCSALIHSSRPLADRPHSFRSVQDQVQIDLLQLDATALNGSQPLQTALDRKAILDDCASRQYDHFAGRLIEIKTMLSRRRFLDVITNPVDDVSGSVGIADDTAERFSDLVQV